MKTPLYCINPQLFQILPNPPPTFLSSPTPSPTFLSVVLFLWLNGWSHHIWYAILLNDDMDLHMSNLGTLLPEGSSCVFYAIRDQVYWGLRHNVVFYWCSDLISHTQTRKLTRHTQWPADWHIHINIYLDHLLCARSSYLYYITWLNE